MVCSGDVIDMHLALAKMNLGVLENKSEKFAPSGSPGSLMLLSTATLLFPLGPNAMAEERLDASEMLEFPRVRHQECESCGARASLGAPAAQAGGKEGGGREEVGRK